MKTVLKTLLLCTSMILTACSLMPESDTTAQKRPVVVENAQEAAQQAPQQAPSAAEPHDQQTLKPMALGTATSDEPIGGSLERSMDSDDKIKMSRALDKSPGRTTSWTNNRNHMHYEVTPVRKVVLKDNPICRTYQMTGARGSHTKTVSGTACVSNDGNWHPQ